MYQNEDGSPKFQHKIIIGFELNQRIKTEGEYKDRRFVVSKRYTLSLSEKSNLFKDLTSWRGKAFTDDELKGFDLDNIIGANCLLNLTENESGDKVYTNIIGITPLMDGMTKMEQENDQTPPDRDWETISTYNIIKIKAL